MTEPEMIAFCQDCGWQDGAARNPCSPPIRSEYSQDAEDAYKSSYLYGLAYAGVWKWMEPR